MEVVTAGRDVAVAVCTAGEALVLVLFAAAALRAWRRPPPAAGPQAAGPPTAGQAGADRALALVLGLMVTSRVLSPQYLLWALGLAAVSYTHLRAHETPEHLVCRLLLEKKKWGACFFCGVEYWCGV